MFFALLLVVLQIAGTIPVQAELLVTKQEIRVGLVSLYSGKETLTIYNNKLGYGYCVDNVFLQEAVLESSSGFVFTPVNGYFIAEKEVYGSYQAALHAAEAYRSLGVEAYPGSSYQCCWHVYFGNASKYADAERTVKMLKDMDMEIVVEGVETADMADKFSAINCDYIQGYYFSKPIPKTDFVEFISNSHKNVK